MRRKIIVGNWKMNKTPSEAKNLITALIPLVDTEDVDVVFCVPFVSITVAYETVADTKIAIGAQNMHYEEKGAFTGEISPDMIYDAGARYVIIGHSERRGMFGETDDNVNKKVKKAFEHNITPIVCCGESLAQREAKETLSVVECQVKKAFDGVAVTDAKNAIIAYEPIWAIGTGKVATGEQAEEVCAYIRKIIGDIYDDNTASAIRIQYGGSVNVGNATDILSKPNIDGALVGGASLSTDFAKIVNSVG